MMITVVTTAMTYQSCHDSHHDWFPDYFKHRRESEAKLGWENRPPRDKDCDGNLHPRQDSNHIKDNIVNIWVESADSMVVGETVTTFAVGLPATEGER